MSRQRPGTTAKKSYTARLDRLQNQRWKQLLSVQTPYRWNLKRLRPGVTLEIGCGIGRLLEFLPSGSVGVDHNKSSIAYVRSKGMIGFTTKDFTTSAYAQDHTFDSLLFAHVLEHLTKKEGIELIRSYVHYLKPGGRIIIFCPQERGFASDKTHVTFLKIGDLREQMQAAGFEPERATSFPFPRPVGKVFTYNEFVVTGRLPLITTQKALDV